MIQGGPGPDGAPDTSFVGSGLEEAVKSPATAGAFEVIPRLVALFEGRVWIISKCGENTQLKTLAWLDHHETGSSIRRTGPRWPSSSRHREPLGNP